MGVRLATSVARDGWEREVPLSRHVVEELEFSPGSAAALASSKRPFDAELARLVEQVLEQGVRPEGEVSKVFLLTGTADPATEHLEAAIPNDATDATGRTTAWVMMQRHASLAALQTARRTSELDEKA